MCRSVARAVAIAFLVFATVIPAQAAPRQDDSPRRQPGLIERIVKLVKHILPLDTIDATWPKP